MKKIVHFKRLLLVIFREDNKEGSPKEESSFSSADTFPLKKDDKSIKSIKTTSEDKKSGQKSSEPVLLKKPTEVAKKSKREKRDGSSDSNDSESEGRKKLYTQWLCFFNNLHCFCDCRKEEIKKIRKVQEIQESFYGRRKIR